MKRNLHFKFLKSSKSVRDCPVVEVPEYAFIGRSNVGKSSLINMLANHKNLAKVSASPGKTRLINHFEVNDGWCLVDLPGYGYAKASQNERYSWARMIEDYLKTRENLVNTFVLIDSRHSPQKVDLDFMKWMTTEQLPFSIVFTKSDKLSRGKVSSNIQKYQSDMLKTWQYLPPVFVTSSISRLGRDEILGHIHDLNSQIL
jgi:GTP-binding protein